MKYRIREQNELKPSGVEWLGDIPKDWKFSRLKYLAKIDTGSKDTQDNEDEGIYPFFVRSKKIQSINTYSFDGEAILTPGDGDIAEIFHHVNCKFDFHQRVYIICNFKNIIGRYLYYYMIINFKKEVKKLSAKTTVDSLRRPMFLDFPVVYHIDEQQEIADFLDEKSKIFDEAISKKEQLISKLELAKQSLISEVVTGKLKVVEQNSKLQTIKREKNELKASGVEWLGDIPKDWQVKKLKYLTTFNNEKSNELDFKIALENIESKTMKYIETKENVFNDVGIIFKSGDILFGKLRPYLAKVYVPNKNGICVGDFFVLSVLEKVAFNFYIKYLMISDIFIDIVNSSAYGTKMPRASWDFVGNLKLPFPNLEEQQKISKYLDEKLIHFDNTIEKTKQTIKKLKEAKEALISQAVTGKIEVL